MFRWAYRLAVAASIGACAWAGPAVEARSAHFDVYSQAGEPAARAALLDFERLYAFFEKQTGVPLPKRPPVRVIAFRTTADYQDYQIRPVADAYYIGTESRDYIVMTSPADGDFHIAAHEYVHYMLHARALDLPPWLNEGLSEFFANLRPAERGSPVAEIPARAAVLRKRAWMPIAELIALPADSPLRDQRDASDLFYAESWALTDMLMAAPEYSPRFSALVPMLVSGTPGALALSRIFGKSLDEIGQDLRAWVEKRRVTPARLPDLDIGSVPVEVSDVSPLSWRLVLADLLLAGGKLQRAGEAYRDLAREAPENPEVAAALALISLQNGQEEAAGGQWGRALQLGLQDAAVCYRYAVLASAAARPPDEVSSALERAVAVQPEFDDAHFMAAHLDNNAGRYEQAVAHLRAMRNLAPARRFSYWEAMAYALTELGQRSEAVAAAGEAARYAGSDEQRARAKQLAEIAQTDLAVQFMRDANGNGHLVTVRIPHNAPDWNPFIEPGDRIRRAEGKLLSIDCSERAAKFVVEIGGHAVTLAVPDPQRVQMRNAPPDFTCGPQPRTPVTAVYAASESRADGNDGIVRGMEFR